MKKYKTDNLEIKIGLHLDPGCHKRIFLVGMANDDDPIENPQIAFYLQANITKQSFNDANFVKHILNFFIKE